jgi:hypothetical protein
VLCSAVIGFLCVSSTTVADTHWANINGSNIPPYSSYATGAHYLQDVIPVLNEGDTLMVAAGEYDLDTTVFIPARTVWAGAGRDSVVIIWTDPVYHVGRPAELGKNVEIYGLEFNYPKGTSFNPAVYIYCYDPDTLRVHDCRFRELAFFASGSGRLEAHNNEFYFGISEGLYVGTSSGWMHHNSFFGKTGGYGIALIAANGYYVIEHNVFNEDPIGRPIGVMVDHATLVEIRNNLFLNSSAPVAWFYASGVIENNTMVVGTGLPSLDDPHNFIPVFQRSYEILGIRNNILIDFTAAWEFGPKCATCDTTGWITFTYNVFWPPKEIHYRKYPVDPPELVKLLDSANFCAYPMFAGDSNYQLQAGSPLIDAGDPTIPDLDGSRSDIGMYGGPGGSTYTYPQLEPKAPEFLWVTDEEGLIKLTWTSRPEADLAKYTVGRGEAPGFWSRDPTTTFDVGRDDTTMIDSTFPPGIDLYYVVTAVDSTGHGSPPSPERSRIISGILEDKSFPTSPLMAKIVGTYPNPFNSSTKIEYFIPDIGARPTQVQLNIYDILGRKVVTVVDERQYPGYHQVSWDGRTDAGIPAASAVYFAKLTIWGYEFTSSAKLVLQK